MQIMELMQSENPRDVKDGIAMGLKLHEPTTSPRRWMQVHQ